jgi:hypothetical protein
MGARGRLDFASEVGRRFAFLVDAHGMRGPESRSGLSSTVRYEHADMSVRVHMLADSHDGAGHRISVAIAPVDMYPAELPDLVEAALFAPRHKVAWKAHTIEAARATLDANALWLVRLMPLLVRPEGRELVRRANEHPTDRAGNPKRRPSNTHWVYG